MREYWWNFHILSTSIIFVAVNNFEQALKHFRLPNPCWSEGPLFSKRVFRSFTTQVYSKAIAESKPVETKEVFNKRSTYITYSRRSYQVWHLKGDQYLLLNISVERVQYIYEKNAIKFSNCVVCSLEGMICFIINASVRNQLCCLP